MSPKRLHGPGHSKRNVQDSHLTGFRWWIIARTPTVLLDYLFEVVITAAAVISGLSQLSGLASSTSITRLLPIWVATSYGAALVLGATTTTVGLIRLRYGTTVPLGLRLLSISCLAYALALYGAIGFDGALTPIVMASTLAVLTAWRSFVLRSTYLLLAGEVAKEKP